MLSSVCCLLLDNLKCRCMGMQIYEKKLEKTELAEIKDMGFCVVGVGVVLYIYIRRLSHDCFVKFTVCLVAIHN